MYLAKQTLKCFSCGHLDHAGETCGRALRESGRACHCAVGRPGNSSDKVFDAPGRCACGELEREHITHEGGTKGACMLVTCSCLRYHAGPVTPADFHSTRNYPTLPPPDRDYPEPVKVEPQPAPAQLREQLARCIGGVDLDDGLAIADALLAGPLAPLLAQLACYETALDALSPAVQKPEGGAAHTYVACAGCGGGVRPSFAVQFRGNRYCHGCAGEYLETCYVASEKWMGKVARYESTLGSVSQ